MMFSNGGAGPARNSMLRIRPMTDDDIQLGQRLREQAGWNQTEADWRRFQDLAPQGCFVAEWDGVPVGTTTTCAFGGVTWIAMVLVEKSARHRGIGTQLVEHAVRFLESQGARTIRLDATALGQPVYQRLGFVAEYQLSRFEGRLETTAPQETKNAQEARNKEDEAPTTGCGAIACDSLISPLYDGRQEEMTASQNGQVVSDLIRIVEPLEPLDLAELTALDQHCTGADRRELLARLLAEAPQLAGKIVCEGHLQGYVLGRRGTHATQIGPASALLPHQGRALLDWMAHQCAGQAVFVDVPVDNQEAVAWCTERRLSVQRSFTRMFRGERVSDRPVLIWASSGPEKG